MQGQIWEKLAVQIYLKGLYFENVSSSYRLAFIKVYIYVLSQPTKLDWNLYFKALSRLTCRSSITKALAEGQECENLGIECNKIK